jgi:hypothetical protein
LETSFESYIFVKVFLKKTTHLMLKTKYLIASFLIFLSITSKAEDTLKLNDVVFSNGVITDFLDTIKTEIMIPNNFEGIPVTSIGASAFNGSQLEQVIFPNSLISIDSAAFKNSQLQGEIYLPLSVRFIKSNAFAGNHISSIIIPASVTAIEEKAFFGNELDQLTFSNSITYIGSQAFDDNQLTQLRLPTSYKGNIHFWSDGTTTFKSGDIFTDLTKAYTIGAKDLQSKYTLTIDDVVFSNGEITDYLNTNEKDIIIPDNFEGVAVTSIGELAFDNSQLISVILPNSVLSIDSSAFTTGELAAITLSNSLISIGSYSFSGNKIDSVIIPNSVTSIKEGAFVGGQLKSVKISTSATKIENLAFAYNELTSIVIPNSVTSIGENAFSDNQLTSVIIPDSVNFIGEFAFYYNQLTSISIPNSLTTIKKYTFAFNQLTSVVIPNSIDTIDYYAFGDNRLTTVEIPNSVTYLGMYAFGGNQLTSVILSDSLDYIGPGAFTQNNLTSVSIPNSVTYIAGAAFSENVLSEFKLPNNYEGDSYSWSDDDNNCYLSNSFITNLGTNYSIGILASSKIEMTFCDSAIIDNQIYTYSQIWSDTLFGGLSSGCDSIVVTNLTINKSTTSTNDLSACGSALFNGATYTSNQVIKDTLTGINGCDSIVITNISINEKATSTQVLTAGCNAIINGNVYGSSQTITDSLTRLNGCDSIVTTYLTISPNIDTIDVYDTTFVVLNDTVIHTIFDTTTMVMYHTDSVVHNIYDTTTTVINQVDTTFITFYDTNYVQVTNYVDVSDSLIIDLTGLITSVNAPFNSNLQVKIYPNPASELLILEVLNPEITVAYSYELINVNGQTMMANGFLSSNTTTIDISSFTGGTYYIKFINTDSKIVNQAPIVIRK